MGNFDPTLSRISKYLTDRDQLSPDEALQRRKDFSVTLSCGADVAKSYNLQLAVLTAARLAVRCFPGAVRAIMPRPLQSTPLKLWSNHETTLGDALKDILGSNIMETSAEAKGRCILFGNAPEVSGALRVTFDGWVAAAGPVGMTPRMPEQPYCPLAAILAASLAVSEVFLSFAEVTIEAGRRRVAMSLWRPDLSPDHEDAVGVPIKYIPTDAWILGLGHLGNAYLWALASLPYDGRPARFYLNDFDVVEDTNVETGVLFELADVGHEKTRVLTQRLETMGFKTRILEREFDEHFRRQRREPVLALCGFDSNPARRHLTTANFKFAVESGLGGLASNFDVIGLHTMPNERTALDMWPDPDQAAIDREAKRQASSNPAYNKVADDECGRVLVAGKSIAVPFVGTTAAAFVVAEVLRVLHGGPAYDQIKLRLAAPHETACSHRGLYDALAAAGMSYHDVSGWA